MLLTLNGIGGARGKSPVTKFKGHESNMKKVQDGLNAASGKDDKRETRTALPMKSKLDPGL